MEVNGGNKRWSFDKVHESLTSEAPVKEALSWMQLLVLCPFRTINPPLQQRRLVHYPTPVVKHERQTEAVVVLRPRKNENLGF